MAAFKWFELVDKRTASRAEDGTVSLSHTYTVVCDSAEDGPIVAVDKVAEEWGYWYTAHPEWPSALLKTFDAQPRAGSPLHFDVTARYDTRRLAARPDGVPTAALPGTAAAPSPAQSNVGPATARPPKFSISRRDNMEATWHDRYGYPIKNSAGDPLEGIEINRPLLIVNVSWFSLNVTLPHVVSFWECVNSTAWNGFPARTLKVEDYSFDETYDVIDNGSGGTAYGLVRECKLVLAYRKGHVSEDTGEVWGWRPRFLDAGKRELVAGKLQEISSQGATVSEPHPLNGSGLRWTPGGDFHYIEPILHEEKPFSGLII